MTNLKQTKSNLAKLMATENITVMHKAIPTAYFDVQNRILACPTFKDDISPELYDLFMGHEVGHALHTPFEGLHSTLKENRTLKGYLNVIEDVRIERKIRDKFQGLRKSFFKAYNELMEKDFFGIKDRNLQELSLIDKINLITKCGSRVSITLTDEEKVFLEAAEKCETWDDVVQVATAIYEWSKENETRDEHDEAITNTHYVPEDDEDEDEDDFEQEMSDFYDDEDEEDGDEQETEESADGDKLPDIDEDGEEEEQEKELGKKGGQGGSYDDEDGAKESLTEHSAHNNEDQFIDDNAVMKTYFDLAEIKDQFDDALYPYKQVFTDWDKWSVSEDSEYGAEFRKSSFEDVSTRVYDFLKNKSKKVVMHMAKEFEMRQTAMRSLKARTGKSGDLDMNKLAKYQIVDDIFKQVTYLPDGKNHGVNVMLDWSGSINREARDLIEQAMILTEFCRKVQIPYRVYLFSDCISECDDEYAWRSSQGKLVEIFSNEQSGREHIKMSKIMSALYCNFWADSIDWNAKIERKQEFADVVGCTSWDPDDYYRGDFYKYSNYGPRSYRLGGTPLNHTLIAMRKYLAEFNSKYQIEKSILTVITDGYSHSSAWCEERDSERKDMESQVGDNDDRWLYRSKRERYLIDPYSGKIYLYKNADGYYGNDWNQTANLLHWLGKETNTTITGYFVFTKKHDFINLMSVIEEDNHYYVKERYGKLWLDIRKTGACINTHGYNKLFLVASNNLNASGDDELSDELEGAKKGRILTAFKKNQKSKTTSRFLTNEFIKEIA